MPYTEEILSLQKDLSEREKEIARLQRILGGVAEVEGWTSIGTQTPEEWRPLTLSPLRTPKPPLIHPALFSLEEEWEGDKEEKEEEEKEEREATTTTTTSLTTAQTVEDEEEETTPPTTTTIIVCTSLLLIAY